MTICRSIFFLLIPLFFIVLFTPSTMSHDGEVHTFVDLSAENRTHIKRCIDLPEFQDSCYFELCGDEGIYFCAENILDAVVQLAGPEKANDVLHGIMDNNRSLFNLKRETYEHGLAHVIGISTSHHYGLNSESLLRCGTDFEYGCQHGFFEDALKKHTSPLQAALEICEERIGCYHGVGHGFMFSTSYNLVDALSLCNAVPPKARPDCREGVFMENVIGFLKNVDGEMGFVDNDPLAPCSRVNTKHRFQCWEYHGPILLHHNNWSIKDASHFCLEAGDHITGCIISLGYLVSGHGWQEGVQGSFQGTLAETTAYLCEQFPHEHISTCQFIGISYFLEQDRVNIIRAIDFCLSFYANVNECFKKIGTKLFWIVLDKNNDGIIRSCAMPPVEFENDCIELLSTITALPIRVIQSCAITPEEYRDDCIEGAQYVMEQKTKKETSLLYLFVGLGSILVVSLIYYTIQKKVSIL